MPSSSNRLTFIDFARTSAVLLALLAHALNTTGTFAQLGDASFLIRPFTRMSTPLFLLVFGFLIEFVYASRVPKVGFLEVKRRLHIRSFQCYFAYTLTSLSAVIGGHSSISNFLSSLVCFSNSRFGNILRVYSILLLLAPLIIRFRQKYGPKFILAALLFTVLSFPVLSEAKTYTFGFFNHALNVLFGIGPAKGGPSIWHSMSIMLAGMYLASGSRAGSHNRRANFYSSSLVLLFMSSVLGALLIEENLLEAGAKFVGHTYRNNNMVGYYLIGIFCTVASITILSLVIGSRSVPVPLDYVFSIGYSSLFSYTLGNILLNLFGAFAKQFNLFLFLVVFFTSVVLLTAEKGRLPFYDVLSDMMNFRYGKGLRRRDR